MIYSIYIYTHIKYLWNCKYDIYSNIVNTPRCHVSIKECIHLGMSPFRQHMDEETRSLLGGPIQWRQAGPGGGDPERVKAL